MTQPPRDADWLLGLAKLRAQQIINLVDMLGSGVPRPVLSVVLPIEI